MHNFGFNGVLATLYTFIHFFLQFEAYIWLMGEPLGEWGTTLFRSLGVRGMISLPLDPPVLAGRSYEAHLQATPYLVTMDHKKPPLQCDK